MRTQNKKKRIVNIGSEKIPKITVEEVGNALNKMKNNKAPVEEKIMVDILKECCPMVTEKLCNIINICHENGKTSKTGTILLLYLFVKEGDIMHLDNFRPMSLFSQVYKPFTKPLTIRIINKLDSYQSAK